MKVHLLGPLEIASGRSLIDVRGRRPRTVLSMLALNPNRVVSVEKLIDAVWEHDPPGTARSQIQICISSLRKLFDESVRIVTRAPGYQLEIAEEDLDSLRFYRLVGRAEEHVDAGRRVEAAIDLRAALGLWRGPALAGVSSDSVRRGAALLENRRMLAEESRLRLDIDLGRHEEVVGELEALIGEQPYRERLYGFLMLALYRSGRQAEALEVGRRARATLAEDVGVDPGQELQKLQQAILSGHPGLAACAERAVQRPPETPPVTRSDPQPIAPKQLPAAIVDFTGREDAIREIVGALSAGAESFGMPIVAVSGQSGVGKSSLAVRVAHELADRFPDGQLYAKLQAAKGPEGTHQVLARFLRALGIPGSALPDDLDGRIEMYRSRLAGERMLILLDGVHSEDEVLPLLPGSPTCATIVTSIAPLSVLSGAKLVDLRPFDLESSVAMLSRIVGGERIDAEPDAVRDLVQLCGQLPLALRIAAARLVARPRWPVSRLTARLRKRERRLDELSHRGLTLRATFDLTYQSLPPVARRLFRLLALAEDESVPVHTAAALLDADPLEAESVLDVLVEAQVLVPTAYLRDLAPRFRLPELFRLYAGERLAEEETRESVAAARTRLLDRAPTCAGWTNRGALGDRDLSRRGTTQRSLVAERDLGVADETLLER